MGDKKAVAIAQEVHLELQAREGVTADQLRHGSPVSSDQVVAGTVVDDLGIIARVPLSGLGQDGPAEAELQKAIDGYAAEGLVPKEKKLKLRVIDGVLWGSDFDGKEGKVRAAREKVWELSLLSLAAIQKFAVSPYLIEQISGGWGFVLLFRRSFFCVLDAVYDFGRLEPQQQPRPLPGRVKDELLIMSVVAPLIRGNLKAGFGGKLWAHDAEGNGGCAFGSAPLCDEALEELWRFTDLRGADLKLGAEVSTHEKSLENEKDIARQVRCAIGDGIPALERDPKLSAKRRLFAAPEKFRLFDSAKLEILQSWSSRGKGLFLELFAGMAGLTAAVGSLRLATVAGVEILACDSEDLTDLLFVEQLLRIIFAHLVMWFHSGIECTTWCIAARPAARYFDLEIGATRRKEKLKPHRAARCDRGDWFLRLTIIIMEVVALDKGVVVMENPATSLLWKEEALQALILAFGLFFVLFDMCEYGMDAKKATKMLTNYLNLQRLARRCSKTHSHVRLQGTVYVEALGCRLDRTALAAAYPQELCDAYADEVLASGVVAPAIAVRDVPDRVPRVEEVSAALTAQLERSGHHVSRKSVGALPETPWEEAVEDLVLGLPWKAALQWKEQPGRHINVYEFRGWGKMIRSLAARKSHHHSKVISIWDSRVCKCTTAKGRSSADQVLAEHRKSLPHLAGGDLEAAGFWVQSKSMPMDGPSRGAGVAPPVPGPRRLLDRGHPLVSKEEIALWESGAWRPTRWRRALYDLKAKEVQHRPSKEKREVLVGGDDCKQPGGDAYKHAARQTSEPEFLQQDAPAVLVTSDGLLTMAEAEQLFWSRTGVCLPSPSL